MTEKFAAECVRLEAESGALRSEIEHLKMTLQLERRDRELEINRRVAVVRGAFQTELDRFKRRVVELEYALNPYAEVAIEYAPVDEAGVVAEFDTPATTLVEQLTRDGKTPITDPPLAPLVPESRDVREDVERLAADIYKGKTGMWIVTDDDVARKK